MSTLDGALKQAEQFKKKYGNYSGPGSLPDVIGGIIVFTNYIIGKYKIKSIIDAPCGDWSWMQYIELKDIDYLGYDIVDFIIKENIEDYCRDNILFEIKDIINTEIPREVDLIICRDFLFHLRDDDILKVINNFKQTGSKYLISTSFDKVKVNPKFNSFNYSAEYGFRMINLELPPFNLGKPIENFNETEDYQCKGRMVGLWNL